MSLAFLTLPLHAEIKNPSLVIRQGTDTIPRYHPDS